MNKKLIYPVIYGISASVLFGASTPLSKILLNDISPILLSALLYLGSAAGLFIFRITQRLSRRSESAEARLTKSDIPYLLAAIVTGGMIAPILLMFSLRHTSAATASLMLNFEVVATMLIAALIFREHIGRHALWAIAAITTASILLSWNTGSNWEISVSALGVLGACLFWGIDNNFTHKISAKDPVSIVTIKGAVAGSLALILALMLGNALPAPMVWIKALLLGTFGYGLSIVFFVLAMRGLGAARAGAYFGIAPFAGVALSFIIFKETPNLFFIIALPLMIIGVILLLIERHAHEHAHLEVEHEHRHCHDDDHHVHRHPDREIAPERAHSHRHLHEEIIHFGFHTPDIHHKHEH